MTLNLKKFLNLTNNKVSNAYCLVLVRTVLIKCGLIPHHCAKYFQKVISKNILQITKYSKKVFLKYKIKNYFVVLLF